MNRFRKGGIVVQVGDRVLIESEKVGAATAEADRRNAIARRRKYWDVGH